MAPAEALPESNVTPVRVRRARPKPSPVRDLQKELVAVAVLKNGLKAMFGEDDDDTELLRDAIEGQTDLHEAVDGILEQILIDRELIAGIEEMAEKRELRKKRIKDRCAQMETLLKAALEAMDAPRLERPLALIFTRAKPDRADVTDEAAVPSLFYVTPEPALDRKALLQALKDRRDTLAGKHDEITERVRAGEMTEEQETEARERVDAAFPPIPGAELVDGGTGVTVKWS